MKTLDDLVADAQAAITEWMPWDLAEKLENDASLFLVDVREPSEYQRMHIESSINVPRGILENACEYDYDETIPQLVEAREYAVVVICRSGKRSALAAQTMQWLGYRKVYSLKTGLRGWNDFDQPMVDAHGETVDGDVAEEFLRPNVKLGQRKPS